MNAPDATPPRASVVVCSYHRATKLAGCLRALLAADPVPGGLEIVVVDNSPANDSVRATVRVVSESAPASAPPLRVIACGETGLSAARNAGLAEARGSYVLFTDDDAVPRPDWAARLTEVFDGDAGAGVVGGPILLRDDEFLRSPAAAYDRAYWSHFDPGYAGLTEVTHRSCFPWGANWAARRAELIAVGGFRRDFGRVGHDFGGGEELVAACEIRRLGRRVFIAPEAKVEHDVEAFRFTPAHVRRTLIAGRFTLHRMGMLGLDGVPRPTVPGLLASACRSLRRLVLAALGGDRVSARVWWHKLEGDARVIRHHLRRGGREV